jgi:transposase
MTCARRLRQWQQSGVWPRIEQILRERLRDASRYDWLRAGEGEQAISRGSDTPTAQEPQIAGEESWAVSAL